MSERRPRPDDFDTAGRYYGAVIMWLDWKHPDDRIKRARTWRKIERKNDMPVKTKAKKAIGPTDKERLAHGETLATLDRLGAGPLAIEREMARLRELIAPETLTELEQAEFEALSERRLERRRFAKTFAERSAKAAQRWDERRGTAWAAKWEARALEGARRYDRDLNHPHIDGRGLYMLHKTVGLEYGENGRKIQARRDAKEARREAKRVALEALGTERVAPGTPVAPTPKRRAAAPATPAEPADKPRKPRRTRVSVEYIDLGN
jgi:hypothetical protein